MAAHRNPGNAPALEVCGRARRIAGEPERWSARGSRALTAGVPLGAEAPARIICGCASTRSSSVGEPVFSFEFFPPKTEAGERNLYAALAELRDARSPSFVSVTYGAGGSTREKTIEIVKRISDEYGLEAMAHFTCVGATVPRAARDAR